MITNILLGLILGIVLSSYAILNKKITQIKSNTKYILTKLRGIDGVNSNNTKLIEHLSERISERVLVDNENYHNIITLLKSRFKDLDNATDSIYNRFNTTDSDIQNLIIAEHRLICRQIEKQAKISSKINPKQKQSKSTQK